MIMYYCIVLQTTNSETTFQHPKHVWSPRSQITACVPENPPRRSLSTQADPSWSQLWSRSVSDATATVVRFSWVSSKNRWDFCYDTSTAVRAESRAFDSVCRVYGLYPDQWKLLLCRPKRVSTQLATASTDYVLNSSKTIKLNLCGALTVRLRESPLSPKRTIVDLRLCALPLLSGNSNLCQVATSPNTTC